MGNYCTYKYEKNVKITFLRFNVVEVQNLDDVIPTTLSDDVQYCFLGNK
jgi:hypothetical protein